MLAKFFRYFAILAILLINSLAYGGGADLPRFNCVEFIKKLIRPLPRAGSMAENEFQALFNKTVQPGQKRIAIFTDAWLPQTNGVVNAYVKTKETLESMGYIVDIINPNMFENVPAPTYPEILLAIRPGAGGRLQRYLREIQPDHIHVATPEGWLGYHMTTMAQREGFDFSTTYHTQFPEYLQMRTGLPLRVGYPLAINLHQRGRTTMYLTETMRQQMVERGFDDGRLVFWTRGVDPNKFKYHGDLKELLNSGRLPQHLVDTIGAENVNKMKGKKVFVYFGRISVEKNIGAFMDEAIPDDAIKLVIGDGPDLPGLREKYPEAIYTGKITDNRLGELLSLSDIFVMPSKTETLGTVLMEGMYNGLITAAYPVQGPVDIIEHGVTGYLDDNLGNAMRMAYDALEDGTLRRDEIREQGSQYTWESATELFLEGLVPAWSRNN